MKKLYRERAAHATCHKWILLCSAVGLVFALDLPARSSVTIDLTTIGNAHNSGWNKDPGQGAVNINYETSRETAQGRGAVGYEYQIGTYNITNAQYAAFLNAVAGQDTYDLYGALDGGTYSRIDREGTGTAEDPYTYSVDSRYERPDQPVNNLTVYSAMRFCNWLTHGQPTGTQGPETTESGYYLFDDGAYDGTVGDRETIATGSKGYYALPSLDEWFKAAYYDPQSEFGPEEDKVTGGYWRYATRHDDPPLQLNFGNYDGEANAANWGGNTDNPWPFDWASPNPVNTFYNSKSYYGVYDMNGNVNDWVDYTYEIDEELHYALRSGRYASTDAEMLAADDQAEVSWKSQLPGDTSASTGFRVVYIPEPGSVGLLLAGVLGIRLFRRHNRRMREEWK